MVASCSSLPSVRWVTRCGAVRFDNALAARRFNHPQLPGIDLRQTTPTKMRLSPALRADVDVEDRRSGLVGDLQVPFVAWFKSTVHVLQKVGGKSRGLSPGGFIVRQVFAFTVGARFNTPDVEKIARHA